VTATVHVRAARRTLVVALAVSSFGTAACSTDGGPRHASASPSSGGAGVVTDAGVRDETDANAGTTDAGSGGAGGASNDADGGTLGDGANGGGASNDAAVQNSDAFDASYVDGSIGPLVCDGPGPRFATRVVAEHFGPGQNFGRNELPEIVLGPPKGGGAESGSLDVASLGNGGSITLAFDGNAIVDGPGPDFIVFENPFAVGGNLDDPYAELGTVAVSDDGVTWTSFPCTATAYPYGSCAGWHYVYANAAVDGGVAEATDPAAAGGDQFDLHDLGISQARFVRITDRVDLPTVFDLDAVSIVNGYCN
jgi:hypothetical protein